VLRQGGLGQADQGLKLPHRPLAVRQLTQDHQPPLVGERAQKLGGFPGAGLETGDVEVREIEHGRYI